MQGDIWMWGSGLLVVLVVVLLWLDVRREGAAKTPNLKHMDPTNLANLFRVAKQEHDPLSKGRAWIGQAGEFYEVQDWQFTTTSDGKLCVMLKLEGGGWITCRQMMAPIWYVLDQRS